MDEADRPARGSAADRGPDVLSLLADPTVSRALKTVLRRWARRDPVDAAEDAHLLALAFGRLADARCGLSAAALNPPDPSSDARGDLDDRRGRP